jgi:hypothetical protein
MFNFGRLLPAFGKKPENLSKYARIPLCPAVG